MSFINEALKRAQEEKNHRYHAYSGVVQLEAVAGADHGRWRIPRWGFVMIVFLGVMSLLAATYWFIAAARPVTVSQGALKGEPVSPVRPSPPDVAPVYQDALNHQRQGEYVIAESLYRQILSLDPRHIYALNNLGVLNMIQKRPDQALNYFQQAIAIKDGYADPHYNLACLYAQGNEPQQSLRHLETAFSLRPDLKTWAAKDIDLKNIHKTDGFKKLTATSSH